MRLRPLAVGDVLDETFRIYRRHFRAFVIIMGAIAVPSTILSIVITVLAGLLGASFDGGAAAIGVLAALLIMVPVGIVIGLAQVVAAAAVIRVASDAILGQPIDVGASFREGLGRLGSLLWGGFLTGLVTGVLVLTCLGIPFAIYLGLGWMLLIPLVMLEGLGATDAMGRSWQLVSGHRWRLLIVSILIGLIGFLLVSIPTGIFSFVAQIAIMALRSSQMAILASQIGNTIFQAIGQTLFGSIFYITLTLLYYDLRVRKEAFDLQQRVSYADPPPPASSVDWAGTPDPPTPSPYAPPSFPPPPTRPPDRQ
jgi:hypothetical protein